MRAMVTYSIIRFVLFAAPFALLLSVGTRWYIALIIAVIFAFCASYIFFHRQRSAASSAFAAARARGRDMTDENVEDADETESGTAEGQTPSSALESEPVFGDANPNER